MLRFFLAIPSFQTIGPLRALFGSEHDIEEISDDDDAHGYHTDK